MAFEAVPALLDWLRAEWPRGLSGNRVRALGSRLRRSKGEEVTLRVGNVIGFHLTRATDRVEVFATPTADVLAEGDWEDAKAVLLASSWDRRGRWRAWYR